MRTYLSLLLLVCLAALGCGEVNPLGGGNSGGGGNTTTAPAGSLTKVAAVGIISSGRFQSQEVVRAELRVFYIDEEERAYLGGVMEAFVAHRGHVIELGSTTQAATFATDNGQDPNLVYEPNSEYVFTFRVRDAEGEEAWYSSAIVAPPDFPTLAADPVLINYVNEPQTLTLNAEGNGTVTTVLPTSDTGNPTFTTWVALTPDSLEASLESFTTMSPPILEVPGEAFPSPGEYFIEVQDYAVAGPVLTADATETLHPSSWFAVGRSLVHRTTVE